jgi:uncharacterized membrane protein
MSAAADELARRVEKLSALDATARAVQRFVRALVPKQLADLLHGEPIGHPLHPALVALPIGSWTCASLLDLTGGDGKAARRLVGIGIITAVPTAAAGAVDLAGIDPVTDAEALRVGFVHALINDVALLAYTGSWLARRRGHRVRGAALALAGSGLVTGSGWLGGHMTYRRGVGVE